jgi:hypothetical protein
VRFEATRLRLAEWLLGVAATALLLDTFVVSWYSGAANHGVTGWQALTVLRYLIVVCALLGLATWWAQATRRAPAVAVCLTVISLFASSIVVLGLIWRVVIDTPSAADAGAYLGLLLVALIVIAAYWSLRVDGIRAQDGPASIEMLRLAPGPDADASVRS